MKAAVIDNGIVTHIWEVPALDCYGDKYHLIEVGDDVAVGATWDKVSFKNPQPSSEQIIAQYTVAIQQRLDEFARTRGYDSILSAATYAASTVPGFAAEGQYCIGARDAAWAKYYEILAAVEAGTRPMPTLDEIFTELPTLVWP